MDEIRITLGIEAAYKYIQQKLTDLISQKKKTIQSSKKVLSHEEKNPIRKKSFRDIKNGILGQLFKHDALTINDLLELLAISKNHKPYVNKAANELLNQKKIDRKLNPAHKREYLYFLPRNRKIALTH